jgi:hypothetical protein
MVENKANENKSSNEKVKNPQWDFQEDFDRPL